ncbi:hypothetical protein HYH03_018899 [Edaphochlamys debaryana]|uniref:Small nuclear ribonucleoprotein Prp3 C-terminal domain-containing protein n=1 Tax=Edaphochlamys debaryana TaxID=47281 RepID=A0A836BMN7_9CHLO|nr:hypothetical protein HYH03_018899 [Edaphochlamys debaryana]|eukprot:KAG2482140.1 hypothetical protein HYH03_018899 [Edaphochlamys debaryana]
MYPPEAGCGLLLEPGEQQALELARQLCGAAEGGGAGEEGLLEALPLISGTLRLPGLVHWQQPVGLRFTLPRSYPGGDVGAEAAQRAARLVVECGGPRPLHEALGSWAAAVVERAAEEGSEALLLAADVLRDAVEELAEEGPAPSGSGEDPAEAAPASASAPAPAPDSGVLAALVWLHHLKSSVKRKLIVQWSRELGLAGRSKPGHPGIVVVEGRPSCVAEFLARMRSLTWQAMQVRGQDLLPLPAPLPPDADLGPHRRLRALPFAELDEGGMGELGALCRAAGLEELFLTALKL